MAAAQKFTTDGRGNGFPFCLQTIEESEMDGTYVLWTLKELMHLFWNLKTASAEGSAEFNQDASGSNPALSAEVSGLVEAEMEEEPFKKACQPFSDSDTDSIEDTDPGNYDAEMGTGVTASVSLSITVRTLEEVEIYRVVNGSGELQGYTTTASFVVASASALSVNNTDVFEGGIAKQLTGWWESEDTSFTTTIREVEGIDVVQVESETPLAGASFDLDDPVFGFWEY